MYSISSFSNNSYVTQILQNLYADNDGEIANFLQFSYQEFCLLPFETPLKKALSNIAKNDFCHAKILAKYLVLLGQTPQMKNCDEKYFSTKELQTEISQKEILFIDVELKEKSILNYKSAILKIADKNIKKNLVKIADEEALHLQILKNLQNKTNAGEI